jgi:hypothetical protein
VLWLEGKRRSRDSRETRPAVGARDVITVDVK